MSIVIAGFLLDLDRKSIRFVLDRADRIFAAKSDVGKADSVQRALLRLPFDSTRTAKPCSSGDSGLGGWA